MADDEATKPEENTADTESAAAEQASSSDQSPAEPTAAAPQGVETPAATEKQDEAPASEASPSQPSSRGDDKKPKDIFAELDGSDKEQPKVLKAKGSKNIHSGILHVRATFNNTMVTITDLAGNAIGWSSSGKMGFRGSRKSTAYAGQVVSQDACRQAMSHGLKELEVRVTGPGSGREAAVRAAQGLGLHIHTIKDVTPIPHNGCRPPKARRV
jgi:small subunit ribosomal protein S11